MSSYSFHFRPSIKEGEQQGSLFLRIIHQRKSLSVTTPLRIYPDEWDARRRTLNLPCGDSPRMHYLLDTEDKMNRELRRMEQVIRTLEKQGSYSVEDVARNFRSNKGSNMLSAFVGKLTFDLADGGQERTARAYRTAVAGLTRFNKGKDIRLEHINTMLIRGFEKQMKQDGKSMNTISFYMRNLRAIYNKAIFEGRIQPRLENPFAHVYTGVYITKKRALTKEEMALLGSLDLTLTGGKSIPSMDMPLNDNLRNALAIFLFCFHARGMSFVDMAYLKKENIKNGTVSYFRKKTGQLLEVKITPAMRSILDYFGSQTQGSKYVFPIIADEKANRRLQYETALHAQNRRLKQLSKLAGIEKNISTHVARHSWATIAKNEKLPLWVISEGLGHSNEKTTYTYLASFDRSIIDKASDRISRAVRRAV